LGLADWRVRWLREMLLIMHLHRLRISGDHFRLPEIVQVHGGVVELLGWRCGGLLMPLVVSHRHLGSKGKLFEDVAVLELSLHRKSWRFIIALHQGTGSGHLRSKL